MNLYEVHCEVKAKDAKCEMPLDVKRAFVSVFVPARTIVKALDGAKAVLKEDHFLITEMDRCMKINLDAWESYRDEFFGEDSSELPSRAEAENALEQCLAFHGPFYIDEGNG